MARGSLSKEVISNQVFIGCPWKALQRWSRFPGQNGGLAKVVSGFDYAASFSCSIGLVGRPAGEGRVRAIGVVQEGLRKPTEPSFGNFYIHGIRGLVFGSALTRR